jgi:hypothetical protein
LVRPFLSIIRLKGRAVKPINDIAKKSERSSCVKFLPEKKNLEKIDKGERK